MTRKGKKGKEESSPLTLGTDIFLMGIRSAGHFPSALLKPELDDVTYVILIQHLSWWDCKFVVCVCTWVFWWVFLRGKAICKQMMKTADVGLRFYWFWGCLEGREKEIISNKGLWGLGEEGKRRMKKQLFSQPPAVLLDLAQMAKGQPCCSGIPLGRGSSPLAAGLCSALQALLPCQMHRNCHDPHSCPVLSPTSRPAHLSSESWTRQQW